jgi:hypothetical protein
MKKIWVEYDSLIVFYGIILIILGFTAWTIFDKYSDGTEVVSGDPCIAAMEVSASTFEDYKELVELTSQNAVHAVGWDVEALKKANSRINELGPDIKESFAHYEQLSEECKND